MSKTILLGFLFLSNLAFGQTRVELNSKHISINDDQVIIVRTSETPETVKLTLEVPMDYRVCTQYGTQYVYGQNSYCGYQTGVRTICRDVCVQTSTQNGGTCLRRQRQCHNESYTVTRSCHYPVTTCVATGIQTSHAGDQVTIDFKLSALGAGETEEFQLVAEQKYTDGDNVIFNLRSLTPNKSFEIKNIRILGLDRIVVKRN